MLKELLGQCAAETVALLEDHEKKKEPLDEHMHKGMAKIEDDEDKATIENVCYCADADENIGA